MNLFLLFQYSFAGVFVVLFVAFVAVMFSRTAEGWIGKLLGLSEKNRILTFLGLGMGGILIVMQVVIAREDTEAMRATAEAQGRAAEAQAEAAKQQATANQHTEQGQRQERLKNAIEHLGHDKDSVRLGGAYELFHLAEETKEWRQTVLDILCAHIRQKTGEDEYRQKHESKPSEEIQSLLTLLFVQDHEVFKYLSVNLSRSWLHRANLRGARLQEANLSRARLQEADLINARLQGANLSWARLQGAYLSGAWLQGAYLSWARLQGAYLSWAQLQGASLLEAQFQGAYLPDAQFQGTYLSGAQFQGVRSSPPSPALPPPSRSNFEERMRRSIGKVSDLSEVIFAGGLSREYVDSIVKDLSDERAKNLRDLLEPYINQPASNQPPNGVVTGVYTAEEAERWIAEYERAMSEVPEESDN